jgi:hypothetical protein
MDEYVECDWCKQIKKGDELKLVSVAPVSTKMSKFLAIGPPKPKVKERVCQSCIDSRNKKIQEGMVG